MAEQPNETPKTFIPSQQPDVIINPAAGGMYTKTPPEMDTPSPTPTDIVSEIKKNESQGGEIILNRVTTYQDAVKEALRTQSISSASLLMAEDRRRRTAEALEQNESIKTPKNRWLLIGTIVLVIAGLGILGFVFFSKNNAVRPDTTRSITAQKFFEPNTTLELPAANLSRNTITKLQQVLDTVVERNTIQQIIITKEAPQDSTGPYTPKPPTPYTTDDFFTMIKARVDSTLITALDPDFFLGVHGFSENETFVLFKINNFDSVFAKMLAWEQAMPDDIAVIFPSALTALTNPEPEQVPEPTLATTSTSTTSVATTSTSSASQIPQRTTAGLFTDEVVANSDARVIKDKQENNIFFYAYIDEEYLFIGTEAQTLSEIKKRIRSAKLVL